MVGLERVLGLERIDLRGNSISQWDEVGRLSELPHIREIWYSDNPFDGPNSDRDDIRAELGLLFAQSGNAGVTFDDRPWTWSETRKIEGLLQSRGLQTHSRTHSRSSSVHQHASVRAQQPSPSLASMPPTPSRLQAYTSPAVSAPSGPSSPASSQLPREKKRRPPRRVINLDENPENPVVKGGSMRLPPKTIFEGVELEGDQAEMQKDASGKNGHGEARDTGKVSSLKVKKKERRRVSASMFEPSTESTM